MTQSKMERKTEDEMERQHQRMDRNGFGDSLKATENRERWKGIVATLFLMHRRLSSKKISNDQELIQSDPISCPQNQKGNN